MAGEDIRMIGRPASGHYVSWLGPILKTHKDLGRYSLAHINPPVSPNQH